MNQTEREVPAEIEQAIGEAALAWTVHGLSGERSQGRLDVAREETDKLRQAIIAALEPERALRELAYLAYMVVESGLDAGRVKTSAIKRLSAQVVKMLVRHDQRRRGEGGMSRILFAECGVLADLDDDGYLWLSTGNDALAENIEIAILSPAKRIALAQALLVEEQEADTD